MGTLDIRVVANKLSTFFPVQRKDIPALTEYQHFSIR